MFLYGHHSVTSFIALYISFVVRTSIELGVAKNIGVKRCLEEELKLSILVPAEPQIMGALGAALIAQNQVS